MKSPHTSLYLRNVIFGVEDSLVSTVGLLAGLAVAHASSTAILGTGMIYIVVEGFSMAVGSYLSETSTQEYEAQANVSHTVPAIGGLVMFASFIVAGLVPIAPYLLLTRMNALYGSVIISLIFLGILGYAHARMSRVSPLSRIIRMVLFGGAAILLGLAMGKIFGIS